MPSAHVINESQIKRSPRVMQIESMFDVPVSEKSRLEWDVQLPLEERKWNVGLIVGPSGAGKSTIARQFFGDKVISGFEWDPSKSILDCFPAGMSIKEITGFLTSVGFSSPPSWVRPFYALSNGEQFRVTIARAMAENTGQIAIDEFTSVVDRQVAQIASHTVQKTIRRLDRQFIAITCHYDVIDWLQPDWVYEPHAGSFEWRFLQRHPQLELEIYPVERSAWRMFRQHHYLSGELHAAAQCFGAYIKKSGELIAFASYLHFPHPRVNDIKQGHRLVVLPDYQGFGIGGRLDDWLGQYLFERGYRYHNSVSHPAMISYYLKSPRWKLLKGAGADKAKLTCTTTNKSLFGRHTKSRELNTRSFEYIPYNPNLLKQLAAAPAEKAKTNEREQ